MKRRKFIVQTGLNAIAMSLGIKALSKNEPLKNNIEQLVPAKTKINPISICTWQFKKANVTAGTALDQGFPALDAVIKGVEVEEENIRNTTVGKGGAPDREGNVTLDACVMNPKGDYGAVVCVEHIIHAAALARKVMENTPHCILASEGAEEFALSQGFAAEKLLTPASNKKWKKWLKKSAYKPVINIENHDTIGMLAIDKKGDISGACTTSGLAYKMKGRVGDSAIIGAGLFVDNEIGGASATGMGEEVLKTVGSFLIVEFMRVGMSPQTACEKAIQRIIDKNLNYKNFQVGYIAVNKAGKTGSYSIHPGFTMMKYHNGKNQAINSASFL